MSTSPFHRVRPASDAVGPDFRQTAHSDTSLTQKVLNLTEAAALVRCSRAHLCNILHGKVRGVPRLPSVRIGRRVLFRRESLERWLQQVEAVTRNHRLR